MHMRCLTKQNYWDVAHALALLPKLMSKQTDDERVDRLISAVATPDRVEKFVSNNTPCTLTILYTRVQTNETWWSSFNGLLAIRVAKSAPDDVVPMATVAGIKA